MMFRLLIVLLLVAGSTLRGDEDPEAWTVNVDFGQSVGEVPRYYASANINSVRRMLEQPEGFDDAVRALGIRMMRFQVGGGLDYRNHKEWKDEDFVLWEQAVDRAYNAWGVEMLMFSISGMKKPFDEDGRMILEDGEIYAEACAELVRRFSPPGEELVIYWEPFNEWDHGVLSRMREHGQDYDLVAEVFRLCAERMREVNPAVMVGGPSMTHANEAALAQFLKHVEGEVDFISWHDYAAGSPERTDAQVLKTISSSNRFLNGVRRLVAVVDGFGLTGIPLFMDEFQVNYRAWKPSDARTVNDFAAVFVGSVFANLAGSGVDGLFIHDVVGNHYGLLRQYDYASNPVGALFDEEDPDAGYARPAAWVYHWFNQLAGGDWVRSEVQLPEWAASSERGVLLEALAWTDGDREVLMLVNKDTEARRVWIDWNGSQSGDVACRTINAEGAKREVEANEKGQLVRQLPPMSVSFLSRGD